MKKPLIIAIVGPSGCGKTTLAQYLQQTINVPTVVSWTTRPIRPGEKSGREHWFAGYTSVPSHDQMIAYTAFGNAEYWVTRRDIEACGDIMTYVIDEKGLMVLMEDHSDEYTVVPILIKRDEDKLLATVGHKRLYRDNDRIHIEEKTYEQIIDNNDTLQSFLYRGAAAVLQIIKKYGTHSR